jgi:hypothetical protein
MTGLAAFAPVAAGGCGALALAATSTTSPAYQCPTMASAGTTVARTTATPPR